MKKFKEKVQENVERILGTTKEDSVLVEQKDEETSELTHEVIDVFQDPSTKSRSYFYAKIRYNPETKQAVVETVAPCIDKTTGYAMILDKENRKYLFDKANGGNR